MTRDPDYLYDLLPAVYRIRDAEQGFPLQDLLRVVTLQVNVVEEDIARLYDNWFIETCEDWVVPYIGDLVGYRPTDEAAAHADPAAPAGRRRGAVLVPRRDVANTIDFRRRKGTLALLERLAHEVAGWPARAVEFYPLLGWTQHLDHQRPARGRYADLRVTEVLDRLDLPSDEIAHGVDVRRTVAHRSRGRHNVPSVGVFVWRLPSYSVTSAPACCIEAEGSQCYTFSVLGNDTPLFSRPEPEADPIRTASAGVAGASVPIRRRAFEHRLSDHPLVSEASPAYYGPGKSLSIAVEGWPSRGATSLISASQVVPADLSDWHSYPAPRDKVLVDPALGRMVFAKRQPPKRVVVSYRYGFSADLGGGEYQRVVSEPAGALRYRVRQRRTGAGEFRSITAAYAEWQRDKTVPDMDTGKPPRAAVIEIADSGVYEERLELALEAGESLQLRAAPMTRPVLRLLDYRVDQPDPFTVTGGRASRFVLDGLLVTGRGIVVAGGSSDGDADQPEAHPADGELCDVTIRHCTLVPGWNLDCDCTPGRPDEPSLTVDDTRARVVIEHSILGSIAVDVGERRGDPVPLHVSDSIVDATSESGTAVSSSDGRVAFAALTLLRSTVIGEVVVHAMALAENSIFLSRVCVARRQVGCVRYCYVPPRSRTPRRHRCQPDVIAEEAGADVRRHAAAAGMPVDQAAVARAQDRERDRVRPVLESLRYGNAAYGRLAEACAEEIVRGADDESELGVFHDLYQPQRVANLRARLDEYTPAGMDAGIFYAS
jgi:hypothetical protein